MSGAAARGQEPSSRKTRDQRADDEGNFQYPAV
jgi:hypothetical protein